MRQLCFLLECVLHHSRYRPRNPPCRIACYQVPSTIYSRNKGCITQNLLLTPTFRLRKQPKLNKRFLPFFCICQHGRVGLGGGEGTRRGGAVSSGPQEGRLHGESPGLELSWGSQQHQRQSYTEGEAKGACC